MPQERPQSRFGRENSKRSVFGREDSNRSFFGREDSKRTLFNRSKSKSAISNPDDFVGSRLYLKGLAAAKQRNWIVAVFLYKSALKAQRRELGRDHIEVARTLNDMGVAMAWTGNVAGAADAFQEALDIRQTALGPNHRDVVETAKNKWMVLHTVPQQAPAKRTEVVREKQEADRR